MGNNSLNAKIEKLNPTTKSHISKEVIEFVLKNTKFNIEEIFLLIKRFEKLDPNEDKVKSTLM